MPLYDYYCIVCNKEFEDVKLIKDRKYTLCPNCGDLCKQIMTTIRTQIRFTEGVYDIGQTEQHISSRRQLKEAMDKHNNECGDVFKQSYAKYLDGYGY